MNKLTMEMVEVLKNMKVAEIKAFAEENNYKIKGFWKMNKTQMIEAILEESEILEEEIQTPEENIEEEVQIPEKEIIIEVPETTEEETIEEEVPEKPHRISRKTRKIVIYNKEGEIAYKFDTVEEALEKLEIYRRKDLIYICNKNLVASYSARSKYYQFDGYKFTFEEDAK